MGGRAVQWAEPTRTRVREPWGRYQFRAPTAVCIWARRGAGKGGRRAWPDFTTRVSRLIAFFTVVVSSSCTRTTAQWIRAVRARLTLALTSRTCVTYAAKKPETAAATDRRRSTTSKTYLAMQYATSNVRSSVSHILDQSFDVWPAFRGRNSPQQYSRPQSLQQSPSLFFYVAAALRWTKMNNKTRKSISLYCMTCNACTSGLPGLPCLRDNRSLLFVSALLAIFNVISIIITKTYKMI